MRRVVAESVIFAYGYPTTGPALMDETDPYPGPPPKGGAEMLAALRGMEQTVLTSGEHSDTEGIVLRYGAFYGPGVPHDELFVRLAKWWALPAMTGTGIVSWVHIDDVAKATADALDHGRGGQIYNIVDDRPQSFGDARELSAKLRRPRPLPIPRQLVGLVAPYLRSPSATPGCRCPTPRPRPNSAGRLFPGEVRRPLGERRADSSVRSFDGRNAAFHAAISQALRDPAMRC